MESTETGFRRQVSALDFGFTPNDSMESTETGEKRGRAGVVEPFHPQRLDGEY